MHDEMRQAKACATAEGAVRLAQEHRIPPTPIVYEVLFHHLGGENAALSLNVDSAFALPPQQREMAMERIHANHLCNDALRESLERIHNGLASEIAEAIDRLGDGVKGNLRMAGELRKSLRDIAGVITKDEMRTLCRHLALTGRTHLDDTQSVSHKLERVQFQLTEMHKELSVLRESAQQDHLTGLPNRRHLEERLARLLDTNTHFCLAMIDLDGFKQINDLWGHTVGDNILRGGAQVLRQNIKGKDFAARYGGDEFALVLPDTPIEGAQKLCENIRRIFGEIMWISQSSDQRIGSLTLSAGLTARTRDDDAGTLINRADDLLYRAKAAGRDRVCMED